MSTTPADLIRDARIAAGLSQADLARRAGLALPVVSACERGRREPGFAMLAKLLGAAGHQLEISSTRRADGPRRRIRFVDDPSADPDISRVNGRPVAAIRVSAERRVFVPHDRHDNPGEVVRWPVRGSLPT